MPLLYRFLSFPFIMIAAAAVFFVPLAHAQENAGSTAAQSLVAEGGPQISLETSEAMFDIGVVFNACGYNDGLSISQPLRMQIRTQVEQDVSQSEEAIALRDKLCAFIANHQFGNSAQNLAQYVSLALFLTPPPSLSLSVPLQQLPPDAIGVEEVLPLLRQFVNVAQLHVIWVNNRLAYDQDIRELHGPISQMTLNTDIYLKEPLNKYSTSRFEVVIEPQFDPNDTNARIYEGRYIVVVSPSKTGKIHMNNVRDAYLHYEIDPLLYARASAIDRLQPFLSMVQDAPIAFHFKNDLVAFVVECLVRAIEARTISTGIPEYKIPHVTSRHEYAVEFKKRKAYLRKVAEARQDFVNRAMEQGFILTEYFYQELIPFEHSPASLSQSIGQMVYGMDVPAEIGQIKNMHIQFASEPSSNAVVQSLPAPDSLDTAENKLMHGDPDGAYAIAQKALADHTAHPDRAEYILARADLLKGNVPDAIAAFHKTIALSKNPRLVAWSHIYLGRIDDVGGDRQAAIAQYKQALLFQDGQQDTLEAAQSGLKAPYRLPGEAPAAGSGQNGSSANSEKPKPKLNLQVPSSGTGSGGSPD
jgi:tetratricopeptide (TPR) repeat protein